MNIDDIVLEQNINDSEDFFSKVVVPAYWGLAGTGVRFGISDLNERLIICSDNYAQEVGFKNFKSAMNRMPGVDYPRYGGEASHFEIQRDFLIKHKRPFNYICKYKNSGKLYITTTEPVLDVNGELIGKREFDNEFKLFRHRELVERFFNRYDINVVALEDIKESVNLTEKEEVVLFMLIAGYSQYEIAELMGISRTYVLKIIAEGLCIKFDMSLISTKLLVDKALSLGYGNFIPEKFMEAFYNFQYE